MHLVYVTATDGLNVYRGIRLQADTVSLVGITGITFYVSALDVQVNTASTGPAFDWSSISGLNFGLSTGTSLDVKATVGVDLGSGAVVAAGTLHLSVVDVTTGLFSGSQVLTFTVTGGSVFAGSGGSLTGANHDTVTPGSVGFSGTGVNITYARLDTLTSSYTGLELTAASLSLVGVNGLQIYVSNLDVKVNTASVGPALDWSTVDGLSFTLSGATSLDIAATLGIDIGNGFVVASGTAHLTTQIVSGGVLSGPQTAVTLTVTGGELWAGVGGSLDATDHSTVHDGTTGISAHGVTITYANITDGLTTYTGLELSVATATLVGIPGVQLYVTNLDVKVNQASGGTSPTPLDWTTLPALGLSLSGATDLSVGGTLGIDIASGFVVASGTFTLTRSVVSGGPVTSQTALKLTISDASLWAGVGGSLDATDHHTVHDGTAGISAHGVNITLASVSTLAATYTGLELTVATASLVGIPGVSLYVTSLDVQVNKSTALTPLDWSTLTIDGGGSFGFGLSVVTDLSVSGTIGVDISGFIAASGSFALERDVVSGSGLTSATALKLTVSNAHLWVGVGGSLDATDHSTVHPGTIGIDVSGVDLKLAAISSGLTSYTGLELKVASASLNGVPGVTVSVSNLDVKVNKATGGTSPTPLDWSALTIDGSGSFGFGLTGSSSLSVSGSLTVDLGGVVTGSSGFSLAEQAVDVPSLSLTGASLLTLTLTSPTLSVGAGGFGFSLGGAGSSLALAVLEPAAPADTRSLVRDRRAQPLRLGDPRHARERVARERRDLGQPGVRPRRDADQLDDRAGLGHHAHRRDDALRLRHARQPLDPQLRHRRRDVQRDEADRHRDAARHLDALGRDAADGDALEPHVVDRDVGARAADRRRADHARDALVVRRDAQLARVRRRGRQRHAVAAGHHRVARERLGAGEHRVHRRDAAELDDRRRVVAAHAQRCAPRGERRPDEPQPVRPAHGLRALRAVEDDRAGRRRRHGGLLGRD